ncbi:alkaline phosphatase D family protein [Haladaptatus sp. DYF46]|uniref:alkaline phosphatase D family protein n=1 Tax=Haladaptatus sp. DYF46 TaxID=2886041 RepID=UPI001E38A808|nr:alkaline phosphatase D family protein [Haladaptatus sp. DYF46]
MVWEPYIKVTYYKEKIPRTTAILVLMSNHSDQKKSSINRRMAIKSLGAAAIGGVSIATLDPEIVTGITPQSTDGKAVGWEGGKKSKTMFPLSVMSGGPTSSGVILWTQLSADSCQSSSPVHVQVATDDSFSDPVYEGKVTAEKVSPDHNNIVKMDLDGKLPADSHLFYRFHHAGVTSQIGRARTLPKENASPEAVRLAVVTCQSYQQGYYPAYSHIAQEDLDYIVHLGDQIYEYAGKSDLEGRSVSLPSGHDLAWTLEDFRHLWETYRGDGFFQDALEQHTFIPTWDDHEIVNNRYWDYENDRPWTKDHPLNDDSEAITKLFADGIQAWWEYNPARVTYNPDAESLLEQFQMWRSIRFGDLLEMPVTDERLFSSLPPGGDAAGQRQWGIPPNAPEADDADRTRLGFEQREWLLDTLKETNATWKAWTNELAISPLWLSFSDNMQISKNYDAWDGYQHERNEIMGQLTHYNVDNFVAFTGDMHTYMVSYLMNDWERTESRTPVPSKEELVGVELLTPGISSNSGTSDFWGPGEEVTEESASESLTNEEMVETVLEENPWVEFFNAKYNGYSVAEFTPDACTWTTYAVDDTVNKTDARREVLRKYEIPEGAVELNELESNDLKNGFAAQDS